VIIAGTWFEMSKKFQEILEKAINDVNKSLLQHAETESKMKKIRREILEEAIKDVNKSPEKLNLQEVKIYRQKIVTQLEYFEDFDKKALTFEDFDNMINLAYDILFKSANLKSTCPSEMNSLVSEIDKCLPEWINICTKITNKFNQFYEDLNDFITNNNIGDNLLTFKIQEELLTKIDEIKTNLHKSDK
ncbi:24374_t:CDS:2, partial [Gigaspora margarita]